MSENEKRLLEALAQIAEVARMAVSGGEYQDDEHDNAQALEYTPPKGGLDHGVGPPRNVLATQ